MTTTRFARPTLSSTLVIATVAALTALVAQPATASNKADPSLTAMIKLDPAKVARGEDLPNVHSQIATAARRVCQAEDHTLHAQLVARECYNRAVRSGEAQYIALREAGSGPQMAKTTKSTPVRILAAADQNRAR